MRRVQVALSMPFHPSPHPSVWDEAGPSCSQHAPPSLTPALSSGCSSSSATEPTSTGRRQRASSRSRTNRLPSATVRQGGGNPMLVNARSLTSPQICPSDPLSHEPLSPPHPPPCRQPISAPLPAPCRPAGNSFSKFQDVFPQQKCSFDGTGGIANENVTM